MLKAARVPPYVGSRGGWSTDRTWSSSRFPRDSGYRRGGDGCILDSERLLVVNPNGSPEKLTAGTGVAAVAIPPDFGLSGLQWSPDGERLLFESTTEPSTSRTRCRPSSGELRPGGAC